MIVVARHGGVERKNKWNGMNRDERKESNQIKSSRIKYSSTVFGFVVLYLTSSRAACFVDNSYCKTNVLNACIDARTFFYNNRYLLFRSSSAVAANAAGFIRTRLLLLLLLLVLFGHKEAVAATAPQETNTVRESVVCGHPSSTDRKSIVGGQQIESRSIQCIDQ